MTLRRIALAMIVVAAFFIALGFALDFLVDWLWFSSVGYLNVFLTIFAAKGGLFFIVFAASATVLWINGALAQSSSPRPKDLRLPFAPRERQQTLAGLPQHLPWRFLLVGGALILGGFIAVGERSSWDLALRFIWQAPYGQSDPLYGKDIGFYLFSLPPMSRSRTGWC